MKARDVIVSPVIAVGKNVTVAAGVVDLWGYVESEVERRAIIVAAETIAGVTGVTDHLKGKPASL
jgi:osmotically-inducible protein OsmY